MITTYDQGTPATGQHTKCCGDCPFRRVALKGWLAGYTPEEWVKMAHGETRFECHMLIGAQCAGSAIYRRNVAKRRYDPEILTLPADREAVFSNPMEFIKHHTL